MSVPLKNDASTPRGRAAERVKLRGKAYLVLAADGGAPPREVELEDLSTSGAGMVAAVDLSPGTSAVLLLELAHYPSHGVRGRVLSSKPLGNSQFRLGMEFDAVDGPTIKRIRYAFFPNDALDGSV